jgi:hypothetical protein
MSDSMLPGFSSSAIGTNYGVSSESGTQVNFFQSYGDDLINDSEENVNPDSSELALSFDLPFNQENIQAIGSALEEADWAGQVLLEPIFLYLLQVIHTCNPLAWEIASGRFGLQARFPSLNRDSYMALTRQLADLGNDIVAQGNRSRAVTMMEWMTVERIATSIQELANALQEDNFFVARDVLATRSPSYRAESVLLKSRHRRRVQIKRTEFGSILVTAIMAGAPSLLAIIAALQVKSVVAKNRSETKRAAADAIKSLAESDILAAQKAKIAVETSKVRADTLATLLDAMAKMESISGNQDERSLVEGLIKDLLRSVGDLSPVAADERLEVSARLQIQTSLAAFAFLARNLQGIGEFGEARDRELRGEAAKGSEGD